MEQQDAVVLDSSLNVVLPAEIQNRVHYHYLNDDFFAGMRNELTEKRLNELAEYAKTIPEPKAYGEFFDDNHFLQIYKLVHNSSLELRHRGIFLYRKILPKLPKYASLLDIGPGTGVLTRWLFRRFSNIVLVDVNNDALVNLNLPKNRSKKIFKINKSILSAEFQEEQFELALLSQVLYYIERKKWITAIKRVYKSIKPGGFIVIILSGESRDKFNLINFFGGEILDTTDLMNQIIENFNCKLEVFESVELYHSVGLLPLLHIAGFFLIDGHIVVSKEALSEYLKKYNYRGNNVFSFTSSQKFILICKNS